MILKLYFIRIKFIYKSIYLCNTIYIHFNITRCVMWSNDQNNKLYQAGNKCL